MYFQCGWWPWKTHCGNSSRKCIKNNHPSRKLIVVGVWTDVFEIREMTSEERAEVDRIEAEQKAKEAADFAAKEAEYTARALKAHRIKTLQNMIQQCDETENWERGLLASQVLEAHQYHIFTSFGIS